MRKFQLSTLKPILLLALVAGLANVTAQARAQESQGITPATGAAVTPTPADAKTTAFIKQAAHDNDLEIALAEIGVRKAQSPELKTFAQQVQQAHIQANNQLKPLAHQYGVVVDRPLSKKDQKELSKLEKTSGSRFDKELATLLLRGHQKDVTLYRQATRDPLPADVKQYAQTTLPGLQEHFQHAQTVAKDVGVSQSTISAITSRTPGAMGGTGTAQEPEQTVGGSQKTEKGAGGKALIQPDFPKVP